MISAKNSELVIQPLVCTLEKPNPTSLTFSTEVGQNPPSQSFTIGIAGTCVGMQITAKVTSGSSWLTASPPNAPVNAGQDQMFTFTVTSTSSSLVAGNYSGSISINVLNSNKINITDCPQTVNVALNVIAQQHCLSPLLHCPTSISSLAEKPPRSPSRSVISGVDCSTGPLVPTVMHRISSLFRRIPVQIHSQEGRVPPSTSTRQVNLAAKPTQPA